MLDYTRTGLRQRWWVDVLTPTRQLVGTLDGVTDFTVTHKLGATIRGSGRLGLHVRQQHDLLGMLVRLWVETSDPVTGESDRHPLLTAVAEVDSTARAVTAHQQQPQLKDRTCLLDDVLGASVSIPAGSNITGLIRQYLGDLGETAPSITESSATTRTGMYFEAGETWRHVVSTLADAAGYAATWSDPYGTLQVHPYVLPSDRPIVGELRHGAGATFRPTVTVDRDVSQVPNHLVMVARGDGDVEPLRAELWDTDPASPWSTVSRGRTIPRVETNVDAADQGVLDDQARRTWQQARSVRTSYTVDARWQPRLLGDRLRLVTGPTPAPGEAGQPIDTTATVDTVEIRGQAGRPLDYTTLTLQEAT